MCIYCSQRLQKTLDLIDGSGTVDAFGFQDAAAGLVRSMGEIDTPSLYNGTVNTDDVAGRASSGSSRSIRAITPMASVVPTSNFSNADINGLLSGYAWSGSVITYSFPTSSSVYGTPASYGDPAPFNGFQALSAAQMAVVQRGFALISQYTGLQFQQITETSTAHAMIRLADSASPSTSYAYYPSTAATAGDVFYGNIRNSVPTIASYAFDTILHEIGHALGLKHGQQADATFGTLPANHNSTEYSIMDYYAYAGAPTSYYTNAGGSGVQSYMIDDIAALQYLYGANFGSHANGSVYSWSPSTGEEFIDGVGQGASTTNTIYESVWDGGGTDTYNLSNFSSNLTVDLRPGAWSTFSSGQLAYLDGSNPSVRARGSIVNADLYNGSVASLIENVIGGAGNDTLTGNDVNNVIDGGAGSDILTGGLGRDTFVYKSNYGADVVADFSIAQGDVVNLAGNASVTSYADLLAHARQTANGTVFDFGSGQTLTLANVALSALSAANFVGIGAPDSAATQSVYRFYVPSLFDHVYTSDPTEAAGLMRYPGVYQYEGVQWKAPAAAAGTQDVYRFYSLVNGEHFYTTSAKERDTILATLPVYRYEGVAFEAYTSASTPLSLTLERFYNPLTLHHHYSASADETAGLKAGVYGPGWTDEGPGLIVGSPLATSNDAFDSSAAGASAIAAAFASLAQALPVSGQNISPVLSGSQAG